MVGLSLANVCWVALAPTSHVAPADRCLPWCTLLHAPLPFPQVLDPGLERLKWASLGVPEFVASTSRAIGAFRGLTSQVFKSRSILEKALASIAATKLVVAPPAAQGKGGGGQQLQFRPGETAAAGLMLSASYSLLYHAGEAPGHAPCPAAGPLVHTRSTPCLQAPTSRSCSSCMSRSSAHAWRVWRRRSSATAA